MGSLRLLSRAGGAPLSPCTQWCPRLWHFCRSPATDCRQMVLELRDPGARLCTLELEVDHAAHVGVISPPQILVAHLHRRKLLCDLGATCARLEVPLLSKVSLIGVLCRSELGLDQLYRQLCALLLQVGIACAGGSAMLDPLLALPLALIDPLLAICQSLLELVARLRRLGLRLRGAISRDALSLGRRLELLMQRLNVVA
mmetsp:Transcript_18863/g.56986  ORF Transcript_18863/g.56986 Transcript_18863/m.56986 type:complete len:200 (-) Transcript_18863:2054-2653(-)